MKYRYSSKIIENKWADPIIIQSFVEDIGTFVEEIPPFVEEKHQFVMNVLNIQKVAIPLRRLPTGMPPGTFPNI